MKDYNIKNPFGKQFNPFPLTVLIISTAIIFSLFYFGIIRLDISLILFLIILFVSLSIRISEQWQKAVVLRFGKYIGLKGPGLFFIFPFVDKVWELVDQRTRLSIFKAETTLTKDTVPVNVDAVVYWMVWDVEKAALEVQEYEKAVFYVAQTALRDTIGKHELSDLLQNREKISENLQKILDDQTNPWGVTCQSVGIKDIVIPAELSAAMSKQAQAERERQARIILGTAETEIAEKFAVASKNYENNPVALQLRGMNMLYEGLKEKGSLMIIPSSALDSMNIGSLTGLTTAINNK